METVTEAIDELAARYGDRVAFVHRGIRRREITYAQAFDRVRDLAGALQTRLEPRSKVLLYLPNSPDSACMIFACAYAGMIAVPTDIASGPELAHRIGEHMGVDLSISSVRMPLEGSVFIEDLEPASVTRYDAKPDDILEIVSTSGTTGDPKGVIMTHRNVVSNVRSFREILDASHRTYLSMLPLSHMLEQTLGLLIPLRFGSRIVYLDSRRPKAIREALLFERVSTIVAVPLIAESLLDATRRIPGFALRMKGLREFIVGGAPIGDEVRASWKRKGIDVYVGYGLTETAPIVSCSRPGDAKSGTVGKPLPGVEIRIEHDEIQVRGDNVTPGYYENENATREAFDGEWFRTGDRGRIEDDHLVITGREKSMILTKSGMNVYPEDIERVLDEHVDESCVVERDGKLIGVALGEFDPDKVRREANAKLPVHMRLAELIRWDGDLPRTRTMKIKRDEVAELVEQGETGSDDTLIRILERFASDIDESSSLAELGIDSLDRMMLVTQLEEAFSTRIDESRITAELTVEDLRVVIDEKPPKLGSFPKPYVITRTLRGLLSALVRLRGVRFDPEEPPKIDGPVLLVSNHESHLDTVAIHRAFASRLSVAAALDHFYRDHRLLGAFATWTLATYPFERYGNPLESFERSGAIMDAGHSILIYPEGTRRESLGEFKPGVGLLARELGCMVLPVHVSGGAKVYGKGATNITPGTIAVRFGEPFRPDPSEDPKRIAERMHDAVRAAGSQQRHT